MQRNTKSNGFAGNNASRPRRSGSVIVMVAGGLVMMLGLAALAVDYGVSVNFKNRLQRTCDAAAVAASAKLVTGAVNQSAAVSQAITIAAANGFTITASDVTFPAANRVRVTAGHQRRYLFGPAIGVANGTVTASALAGRSAVTGMTGALPLGITRATYETYRASPTNTNPSVVELVLTRNTQEKFGPLNGEPIGGNTVHNVIALDLRSATSGNSGALFQEEVGNGSMEQVVVQTQIDPLGSSVTSQGNKMAKGIDERLAAAAKAPFNDPVVNKFGGSNYNFGEYGANNPRVVWILVGADGYLANNSNPKLDLTYFAQAYITGPVNFTRGNDPQAILPLRIMSSGELSANTHGIQVSNDPMTEYDTGSYVNRLLG